MSTQSPEKIGKDLKAYIAKEISGMAESHLECWKDRYARYGGNKKRMQDDVYHNHDSSLEIDRVEEDLGRKLNGKESDHLISRFNKEVMKQWAEGTY